MWLLAVPRHETPAQSKIRVKVKSIPAAVTAAVESMKKTMPVPAAIRGGQHYAAHSTVTWNSPKHTNRGVNASEANHRATIPGQEAGMSQAAHAEPSKHDIGNCNNADAAESASKMADAAKSLSIDRGLDALHHALKVDLLDANKLNAVYRRLVEAYRTGKLGRYTLDNV